MPQSEQITRQVFSGEDLSRWNDEKHLNCMWQPIMKPRCVSSYPSCPPSLLIYRCQIRWVQKPPTHTFSATSLGTQIPELTTYTRSPISSITSLKQPRTLRSSTLRESNECSSLSEPDNNHIMRRLRQGDRQPSSWPHIGFHWLMSFNISTMRIWGKPLSS